MRARHLHAYLRFPGNVRWETMLLGCLIARGTCNYLDRTLHYFLRYLGGLWHISDRLQRLEMSWQSNDALEAYFSGRFGGEFADRKFCIHGMDAALPSAQTGRHGRQVWALLPRFWARTWSPALLRTCGHVIRVVVQPSSVLWVASRQKLALRHRRGGLAGP